VARSAGRGFGSGDAKARYVLTGTATVAMVPISAQMLLRLIALNRPISLILCPIRPTKAPAFGR
jgi:hypothetical protein